MNWKTEAKEKLRRYEAMKLAAIHIQERIACLESDYTAIRGARSDAAPIHGGTSGREEAIIHNIVERQELAAALQSAAAWVRIVDRALGSLRPEEKKILQRMYLYPERGTLERLCKELGVETSSIYRRRDRILQTFTLALYGTTGEERS